jgi:cysteinyl-tRNA synthetase
LSGGAPEGEASQGTLALLEDARRQFEDAMDDDFGTPGAIAALFELNRQINARLDGSQPLSLGDLRAVDSLYRRLAGDVLGVLPDDLGQQLGAGLSADLIEVLIDTRARLRQSKQWALADGIRDQLETLGIQLQDRPEGTSWTLSATAH